MIFRRRKREESPSADEPNEDETTHAGLEHDEDEPGRDGPAAATMAEAEDADDAVSEGGQDDEPDRGAGTEDEGQTDWAALDAQEWRQHGPFDSDELDPADDPDDRLDLGGVIIRGLAGMELRLQVAEETQQIVSVMLLKADSALEVAAFAAPRSGGLWTELREEIIEAATQADGTVGLVEGPFGTELRRLLPMKTAEGTDGYQASRMWVAEGPRWLLRGIVYGEAATVNGVDDPAVAELLEAFRAIIVRRGEAAMAPGDLLPLQFPKSVVADDEDASE